MRRKAVLAAISAAALLGATGPAERVVPQGGLVAATINGQAIRMRIAPAATAIPIITSAGAARAGLNAGPFEWDYQIGPERITGDSAVGRIDVGGGVHKRRLGWTSAPLPAGLDGVIGPGMLPEQRVRFTLGLVQGGERTVAFRMVGQGGLEEKWGERFALIDVGGGTLRVQFDPYRPRSLATANAGARIAASHGGRFSGPAVAEPIAFGVRRPVRPMTLEDPLAIGSLSLERVGVRTADFGSARNIGETTPGPVDRSQIVVIAEKPKAGRYDQLIVGADLLDACSSIVFDRSRKRIELTCR